MFSFRFAIIDDADAVRNISKTTFYHAYSLYNDPENMENYIKENFNIEQIEKEISDPGSKILLVNNEQEIVGYAKLKLTNEETPKLKEKLLEISRFYIATELIGKGIGKLLMKQCLEFAVTIKAATVKLAVWKQNNKAISFYKKFDFEITGECSFLLGKELQADFIMKRFIKGI